jgi:hypothetical protein
VCGVPDNGKQDANGVAKYTGCRGAKSTRKFAPGHDAKLKGYLTREYAEGKRTADAVIEEVRTKSGNSALLVGAIKRAVKTVDEAKVAKDRKAQAAQDKAAASASTESAPDPDESNVNDQAIALAETGATL